MAAFSTSHVPMKSGWQHRMCIALCRQTTARAGPEIQCKMIILFMAAKQGLIILLFMSNRTRHILYYFSNQAALGVAVQLTGVV
jgi:hypothetical protein